MAFSYTKDGIDIWGTHKVSWGTFTNGAADTGGEIKTGLSKVKGIKFTVKGTTSAATYPEVNETFPLAGGSVTIVTEANQDGYWFAWGI